MPHASYDFSPEDLAQYLHAYRLGDAGAADHLGNVLQQPLRRAVAVLLGDDNTDRDDVVQESLLAALTYLRRDQVFQGDFLRLAITIARNRCRDLLRHRTRFPHTDIAPLADWIADTTASPLDHLENEEKRSLLQLALQNLGQACRSLLHAMYVEEVETDVIRRRLGLGTVQAVYYRRTACLDQVKNFLQGRLGGRSGVARAAATTRPPRLERSHER